MTGDILMLIVIVCKRENTKNFSVDVFCTKLPFFGTWHDIFSRLKHCIWSLWASWGVATIINTKKINQKAIFIVNYFPSEVNYLRKIHTSWGFQEKNNMVQALEKWYIVKNQSLYYTLNDWIFNFWTFVGNFRFFQKPKQIL